jgi:hypothetical protein
MPYGTRIRCPLLPPVGRRSSPDRHATYTAPVACPEDLARTRADVRMGRRARYMGRDSIGPVIEAYDCKHFSIGLPEANEDQSLARPVSPRGEHVGSG